MSAVTKSHLVTGSALLDLVSEAWLTSLAAACSASGCGVLFALSYDGRIEWGESTEDDELVRSAVNGHQRRDKGLGPALGPSAAPSADDLFRGHGYRTWLLPSPWRIGPDDAEIAVALLRGWAAAAAEERRGEAARVEAWASYRDTTIRDGDFRLRVGHLDLLALPEDQVQESS